MSNLIKISNLNKSFENLKKINVLKKVSYKFKKGKIYSIIGPSGSGKSTLLNLLSLIDRPSSGSVMIDNHNINFNDLKNGSNKLSEFINDNNINKLEEEQVEINIKYGGYLKRENDNVEKSKRLEDLKIPDDFEFHKLHSISSEAKEKLSSINPKTIGQAKRISGVSPADVNVLLVYMGR